MISLKFANYKLLNKSLLVDPLSVKKDSSKNIDIYNNSTIDIYQRLFSIGEQR